MFRRRTLGLPVVLILGACEDPTALDRVTGWTTANRVEFTTARPAEKLMQSLSTEFPGFGGYFLDGTGALVVYVADSAQNHLLRGRIADMLDHGELQTHRSRIRSIVVRRAQFDFASLAEWRERITNGMLGQVAGVVSVDADEQANRVTIGLDKDLATHRRGEVIQRLRQLGIPIGAIQIVLRVRPNPNVGRVATPPLLLPANATLTDVASPVVAGYKVFVGGSYCTLGPTILHNGNPAALTSSHCTYTMYGADAVGHMETADQEDIAVESIDPASFACLYGPGVFPCRNSDAALFTMFSGVPFRRGAIAHTVNLSYSQSPGSLNVDQNVNFVPVTYVLNPNQAFSGEWLIKTGLTTGSTTGPVTSTCTDILGSDGYVRRCSGEATYFSDYADSGAPVWESNTSSAFLLGIHWGNGGGTSSFSYFTEAMAEIGGTYNATTDITVSPSTLSGSISTQRPQLSWTGVTVNNSPTSTTTYTVRRRTWSGSSQSYTEIDHNVLVTQSQFSVKDFERVVDVYYGSTMPAANIDRVDYYILANNYGVTSVSNPVYYRLKPVM